MGRKSDAQISNGKMPAEVAAFLKAHGDRVITGGGAGTYGATWSPAKPGDSLVGTIVDYRAEQGDNDQDVISVKDSKGTLHSVWLSAVLAAAITKADVGAMVCLTFTGFGRKPKRKGWSPAKLYNVYKVPAGGKRRK
jgi:hypothetical protein